MAWLRDPIWQFAGTVVSVAAIAISLWVAWRQHRAKKLAYMLRVTRLLALGTDLRDSVEIRYRGQVVPDVSLVECEFTNSGSVPIQPDDFFTPLTIDFGESAQVLSASVVSQKPANIGVSIVPLVDKPRVVTVEPLLLNAQDTFTIKCLVSGESRSVVAARVAGISALRIRNPERLSWLAAMVYLSIGIIFGVLASLVEKHLRINWLFSGIILTGLVSVVISLSLDKLKSRRAG